MEYEAEIVDGKPVIKAKCERVQNKDGGWDVVCKVPSLKIINKFQAEQKKEG